MSCIVNYSQSTTCKATHHDCSYKMDVCENGRLVCLLLLPVCPTGNQKKVERRRGGVEKNMKSKSKHLFCASHRLVTVLITVWSPSHELLLELGTVSHCFTEEKMRLRKFNKLLGVWKLIWGLETQICLTLESIVLITLVSASLIMYNFSARKFV